MMTLTVYCSMYRAHTIVWLTTVVFVVLIIYHRRNTLFAIERERGNKNIFASKQRRRFFGN